MQKITSTALVDQKLSTLKARVLYHGKTADVLLVKRTAFAELFSTNRDSRCWEFLTELRTIFPSVFLWTDSNHNAGRQIGPPEFTCGQRSTWKLPVDIQFEKLLGNESDLGWALLYFADIFRVAPEVPESLPTDAAALEQLANEMRVNAVVISWYDDTEWLVVRAQTRGQV